MPNLNYPASLSNLTNEDNYLKYLNDDELKFYKGKISEILDHKNELDRINLWNEIEVKLKDINNFKKLANPYYIGYGNPDSELLIIGQEKAFNLFANPIMFFNESINNQFLWSHILKENDKYELSFDPRNPRKRYRDKFNGNHTWCKYSILTDSYFDIDSCLKGLTTEYSEDQTNTLFDKAFITELNVTPAKTNSGVHLTAERKEVLTSAFFKTFKRIVFAIGNPESERNQDIASQIFPNEGFALETLGSYGTDKNRYAAIAKSEDKKIAICNQLSGSSGWKNEHIQELGKKLRAD